MTTQQPPAPARAVTRSLGTALTRTGALLMAVALIILAAGLITHG